MVQIFARSFFNSFLNLQAFNIYFVEIIKIAKIYLTLTFCAIRGSRSTHVLDPVKYFQNYKMLFYLISYPNFRSWLKRTIQQMSYWPFLSLGLPSTTPWFFPQCRRWTDSVTSTFVTTPFSGGLGGWSLPHSHPAICPRPRTAFRTRWTGAHR